MENSTEDDAEALRILRELQENSLTGQIKRRIQADAPSESDANFFNKGYASYKQIKDPEFWDIIFANPFASWHDYEYSSLRSATRYFRLLRLLPGDKEPIQCTLKTRDIRYANNTDVAVSYVWGTSCRVKKIKIDGLNFRVPYNCWVALWQMRNSVLGQYQHFWLDFICIDQNNIQERNQQVQIMGEIFANAAYVAACIGTSLHDQDFEILSSMGPKTDQEEPSDSERRRLSTVDLSGRPYFGRLWIVQECWLARSVRVYCGSDSISGEGLVNRCCGPGRDVVKSTLLREANTVVSTTSRGLTLSKLVAMFAERLCTDPRDKIYALLSLTAPADRRFIPIDYGRTCFELMRDHASILCVQAAQSSPSPNGHELLVEAIRSLQILQRCYALDSHFCDTREGFLAKRLSHLEWQSDDSILQSTLHDKYLNIPVKTTWELHAKDFKSSQSDDVEDIQQRTVVLADFPSWTPVEEVVQYVSQFEKPREARLEQLTYHPWTKVASLVFLDDTTAMRVCKALDHAKYYDRRLSAFMGSHCRKSVRLKCEACSQVTIWHVPHKVSTGDMVLRASEDTALVFRSASLPVPHYGLIALAKREQRQLSRCHCEQAYDWRLALHEEDLLAVTLGTSLAADDSRQPTPYFVDSRSYLIENPTSDPIWFGSYQ